MLHFQDFRSKNFAENLFKQTTGDDIGDNVPKKVPAGTGKTNADAKVA